MFFSLSLGKFYGIDSIIEFLIIIVACIISLYSHKIYKIVKEENYKYFSWAFLFIAVSFLFKILSNFTIMDRVKIVGVNFVYTIFAQSRYMPIIDFFSFIFYKTFHLIGFLILFLILTKTNKKDKIALYIYLSIITILFSIYFNFVFHMTLVIILLILTLHFHDNYKEHKNTNTLLVYSAFVIILISHFVFVFSDMNSIFYMVGEGSLLIGFLCLLINHIKIRLYFKKNNKPFPKKNNKEKNLKVI
jgi:hypothetical protein